MAETMLHEDLVLLNYTATSQRELLNNMAQLLKDKGYVKDSYAQAIIDRENTFATGLNTNGVKVAMPHTYPEHVNKPAIMVAQLTEPVIFKEMGNNENDVAAKLIFMLAVSDPKGHVDMLGKLMSIFSDGEKLSDIYNSPTAKELITKLEKVLN